MGELRWRPPITTPLEAKDIPREATHVRGQPKSEAFDEVCAAYAEALRELKEVRFTLLRIVRVPWEVTMAKRRVDAFLDPRRTHDALARGLLLLTRGDAVEELRAENARLRAALENRS